VLTIFKSCQSTLLHELRILNFEEFLVKKSRLRATEMKFLRETLNVKCLILGQEDCRECRKLLVGNVDAWQ
jgi:hypothetical protein